MTNRSSGKPRRRWKNYTIRLPDENLVYHSIDHTRNVVEKVNEIAAHYELPEKDVIVLNIAAWFHDAGHLFTDPSSHEQKSVELMKEWLADKGDYAALMDEIEKTILATKFSTAAGRIRAGDHQGCRYLSFWYERSLKRWIS